MSGSLAFAVCAGEFQLTWAVLVTIVPMAKLLFNLTSNLATTELPGASVP
jgi:hypothetical protein